MSSSWLGFGLGVAIAATVVVLAWRFRWVMWVGWPVVIVVDQVEVVRGKNVVFLAIVVPVITISWFVSVPWDRLQRWLLWTFRCRRGARCVEPPMPQLNPETMEAFGVQGGDTGSVTYDCPVCGTRYWASMMYFDDGSAVLAERKRDADLRPIELSFSDLDD